MSKSRKVRFLPFVLALAAVISLSAVQVLAADVPVEAGSPAATDSQAVANYKAEVVRLVNIEREKAGVADLAAMDKLADMADVRAQEASTDFRHVRPDGSRCFTIFGEYSLRYYAAGENLACGFKTPEEVVKAWMNSASHKQNLLDADFTYIGIGYYLSDSGTPYWSQLFYTPKSY
ncbi:Uncharacterized conserved protein YkwD, contains CAP (CSP/antigen 5/PR1) domain [Sporobacter termitidis DSM 10068]|uniref:Uncharacterized conserved protein YkwD, contains CAP (CSP/antigen 5/PR1) domain n=1 Tax=Sporobacter termitidis DSM 10068 TaxID=1123282 RepID=A0A1M5UD69_9FIRM|nr:CAP domain-containing protein [Sporobacter termitidis]SHH60907.1 Uncharacterized conserved protein YkwD, contains CAP (CSP/antigen 5/PR1) domain [Sporobacter termitidis DSM 10068]